MPAILKPLEIEEISFVDKGASGDDNHRPAVVFWKSQTEIKKMDLETILAAMPEEQRNVIIAALAAAQAEEPPAPEVEVEAQDPEMDPDAEKQDEEPEAEKAEEDPEAEKAEDEETEKRDAIVKALTEKVAKLEAEKEIASFAKQAADEMGYVPGLASEDLGAVLKAAKDGLDGKIFKRLVTTLTACSRAIEKGELLVEVGGQGESEKPMAKLDRLAKELHGKTPDATYENCYTKVLKAHPELYAASRNEGV